MNKEFDDILSEKLKQLPVYPSADKLWNKIEAELDADDTILKYLPELPDYHPSAQAWEFIDTNLQVIQRRVIRRRFLYLAASILLLFTIPWLLQQKSGVVVESEFVLSDDKNTPEGFGSEAENPIEMFESLCKTGAPVCKSEVFKEKIRFYLELEEELRHLEEVIDQIGSSPEIIHSVIRIENLKSDTFQELIMLVHS